MKKGYILSFIIFALALFQPVQTYADMGPKPCIYVTFENIGDRTVYASFYALEGGPSPVSYGNWEQVPENIRNIFWDYSETDGARFVEDIWIINKEKPVLDCGYMPPRKYKLVVYIPEEDKILESGFYTRQKFEEKYQVDIKQADGTLLLVAEPYDWAGEVLPTAFRVALTILIEIAIAFLFKIKGKKTICVLIITNVVTQLFLNISLSVAEYRHGGGLYSAFLYFIIEIIILIVEALVYTVALKKTNEPPVKPMKAVAYAFVANFVTFLAGLFI